MDILAEYFSRHLHSDRHRYIPQFEYKIEIVICKQPIAGKVELRGVNISEVTTIWIGIMGAQVNPPQTAPPHGGLAIQLRLSMHMLSLCSSIHLKLDFWTGSSGNGIDLLRFAGVEEEIGFLLHFYREEDSFNNRAVLPQSAHHLTGVIGLYWTLQKSTRPSMPWKNKMNG